MRLLHALDKVIERRISPAILGEVVTEAGQESLHANTHYQLSYEASAFPVRYPIEELPG